MAESKVFDVKFHFSMSKSPWGQVLSRFGSIGDGFIRVDFPPPKKKIIINLIMGVVKPLRKNKRGRGDEEA